MELYRATLDVAIAQAFESMAKEVIEHSAMQECQYDFNLESLESLRSLKICEINGQPEDAETIRQLFLDEYRLARMKSILENMVEAVVDIQSRFNNQLNPISSKLSVGLESLPDEILSRIFDFATSSKKGGRKHGIWLSHVSHRFRSLILELRSLWTTLDSKAEEDELKAIISRSGHDIDLNLIVHTSGAFVAEDILSFLDICLPTAARWTTLTIRSEIEEDLISFDFTMRHISRKLRQLDFPRLREFNVKRIRSIDDPVRQHSFTPSWSAPNLQYLRCVEYIPEPAPSFQFITSLVISTSMTDMEYSSTIIGLFDFLESAPNIVRLDLSIQSLTDLRDLVRIGRSEPFWHLSITTLALKFTSFRIPRMSTSFPRPFTKVLYTPKLTEFSASVTLHPDECRDSEARLLAGRGIIFSCLLPDQNFHPNLTSVSVEITRPEMTNKEGQDWSKWHLGIPLGRVPHIRTLNLKTFTSPHFMRCEVGGISEVRRLRFGGWERRLSTWTLHDVVESLKKGADWDNIESIEVDDAGGFSKQEDVVAYIQRAEKICFINCDAD